MRKLAIAAIVAALLATATSGAALWRTRHLSTSSKENTPAPTSELIEVPDTTNKSVFAIGKVLTDLKLRYQLVRTGLATPGARAIVLSQNPAPGTKVPADTTVELTITNGSP